MFPDSRFLIPDQRVTAAELPGIRRKKLHVAGKPERAAGAIPGAGERHRGYVEFWCRPSLNSYPQVQQFGVQPSNWIGFYTHIRPLGPRVTLYWAVSQDFPSLWLFALSLGNKSAAFASYLLAWPNQRNAGCESTSRSLIAAGRSQRFRFER